MHLSEAFSARKNGQWYDTTAAKEIGHIQTGSGAAYLEERLYGNDGRYFLHALGARGTRYAKNGHGSEEIIPLTTAEAQQWAGKNLDASTYRRTFPDGTPPPEPQNIPRQDLQAALDVLKAVGYKV